LPSRRSTSGRKSAAHPVLGRLAGWALAMSTLTLLAACSAGSVGPGVASASSSASPARQAGELAFAVCMRSHGVPNFPDPGGDVPRGPDKQSPQFRTAMQACGSLLPQGQGSQPSAADKESFLRFSACVRAHGVPNYPDPVFPAGGGAFIGLPPGMSDSAPTLQAAEKACSQNLPGGGPKGQPKGG
jgi:hypothetical protein